MKYYITAQIWTALVSSESGEARNDMREKLQSLVLDRVQLVTSVRALTDAAKGMTPEIYNVFIRQAQVICDHVYPVEMNDLHLAARQAEQYGAGVDDILDLSLAVSRGCDRVILREEPGFDIIPVICF